MNETYDEKEFEESNPQAFAKAQRILDALDGEWDFAYYHDDDGYVYIVVYVDSHNEDRTFSMEWNGDDVPLELALIEVAND
jgi:hypothetical protein